MPHTSKSRKKKDWVRIVYLAAALILILIAILGFLVFE